MTKPRRKHDIRAAALAHAAALKEVREARAAFLQPRPRSWHDVVLAALRRGASVGEAASAAGVSRAGVHYARHHEPHFEAAYAAAITEGKPLRKLVRKPRSDLTAIRHRSTQKRASDTVRLIQSGLTIPQAVETQRQASFARLTAGLLARSAATALEQRA